MEVRVLGPVEAIRGGKPLPIGRPRWRALLAALALRASRPLTVEQLIDALWDTDPPVSARRTLHSHVARLRRALEPDREPRTPPEVLVTVPGGYMLDLEPDAVDAHRFAELVEGGRRRLEDGDPEAALDALDDALALWRGEPLAEVRDTLFATAERGRLDELRLHARTARLEGLLAVGENEVAAAEAEALTREHSLHEPSWAALAAARYKLGRQADALETMAELRRRIVEELGVDPSPELRGLEQAVLNQEPRLDGPWPLRPELDEDPVTPVPSDLPIPAPVALVRTELPFVGRIEERRRLEGAWKTAIAGERRVVFLSGEPGVGKTRLAAEIARAAHDGGGLVLAGHCDERLSVPYEPFIEALTPCAERADPRRLREALGPRTRHLARLLPLDDTPAPPEADPENDRYKLFDAVTAWLRHLTNGVPLLLLVDDLHWATRPTLLLLRHLVRAAEVPMLLVATYRDTELDLSTRTREVLVELPTYPDVEHVRLGGLDPGAVRSAVELVAPEGAEIETTDLALAVHEKTEGNALFVEELLTDLFSRGTREGLRGPAPDLPFPDDLRDLVERRLSGFPDETTDVLQTAAVMGRAWDVPTVVTALGDEDRVLAALDDGLRAGLLRERDRATPVYEFTHELVHQALEERLSAARRQQRHRRVADAIEELHGPERIGAIAVHLRRAGSAADVGRAVTASMLAAEQARRSGALEDAREHAAAAVALIDEGRDDNPARTARVRELLGDAMYATGVDPDAGLGQLELAREAYEELGDHRGAAKVRSRIGRNLSTFFGHIDVRRARSELEAALEVLEPMGPSAPLAFALIALATSTSWDLRAEVGREAADQALEIAREIGHEAAEVNALAVAGQAALGTGSPDEGQRLMAEAHDRAVALGDPLLRWLSAYTFGLSGNLLQDPHTWYGWVADEAAAQPYDDVPELRAALLGTLREWRILRRGPSEADPDEALLSTFRPRLAADMRGRWEEAATAFLEAAETHLPVGNRNLGVYALWWASREREQQGWLDEAIARARHGLDELPRGAATWARLFMESRLAILAASRDRPRALEHLEACRTILASGEDYRGLAGQAAMAEGVLADTEDGADRAFARARDTYRRTRNPFYEAEVLLRWGSRRCRPEHFDAAEGLHERLGTGPPWRERVRALRAEALGR